jgi:mannitol-specific phosphotransferase system IIBC component
VELIIKKYSEIIISVIAAIICISILVPLVEHVKTVIEKQVVETEKPEEDWGVYDSASFNE